MQSLVSRQFVGLHSLLDEKRDRLQLAHASWISGQAYQVYGAISAKLNTATS